MGKSVTLSKKHGLNPSMVICPICGKEESVAILGYIKDDKEAPRYIQGDICDECKARVADNKCFVISVGEDQRLKRYTIVSKDIFTQKVEGCAVLMKEADFNAVFDKHLDMEHVYVFDYCTSSIYHFTVKNDEDIEDIIRDKSLILDDCYYMTSESPIDIKEL